MMEENYSFLEFLIDSPVYLISDQKAPETKRTVVREEDSGHQFTPETPQQKVEVITKKVMAFTNKINSKDSEFLYKILQAVKISPQEACISENAATAPKNVSSNIILFFGNHSEANSLPFYSPIQQEGKTLLHADDLADIQQNVNKKKQLWANLQSIFKL